MTNEDMYNGITDIKDNIILEADTYEFKKEKRSGVRKPVYMLAVAACLCIVAGVSAFVISVTNGAKKPSGIPDNEVTATPTHAAQAAATPTHAAQATGNKEQPEDISEKSGKPSGPAKLYYHCPGFVPNGEKLIIDLYIGDSSFERYENSEYLGPCRKTYGAYGYPLLSVYSAPPLDHLNVRDGKMVICGQTDIYEKIYSQDDMVILSKPTGEYTTSNMMHETIDVDFSGYNVGDSGEIVFWYHWQLSNLYSDQEQYRNFKEDYILHSVCFVVQENGVYLGYYYGVPREIRDIDYLPLTPEEMEGIHY